MSYDYGHGREENIRAVKVKEDECYSNGHLSVAAGLLSFGWLLSFASEGEKGRADWCCCHLSVGI